MDKVYVVFYQLKGNKKGYYHKHDTPLAKHHAEKMAEVLNNIWGEGTHKAVPLELINKEDQNFLEN